jgi:hypothetical protein
MRTLENNIKMYLTELRYEGVDWINLAQYTDSVAGYYEEDNKASGSIKVENILTNLTINFSRRALLHGFSCVMQYICSSKLIGWDKCFVLLSMN